MSGNQGRLLGLGTPSAVRFICRRYGLPDADAELRPVARGVTGRVWKLTTAAGPFAAKESFWEDGAAEEIVAREVEFQEAARSVGVLAPTSIAATDGTYLTRLPKPSDAAFVRLYEWVQGRPVERAEEGVARWTGRTLGLLHGLRHRAVGLPHPWYEQSPSMTDWQNLLTAATDAGAMWAGRLEQVLPVIDDLSSLVSPADRDDLIVCHLDFDPSNVLVGRAGERVLLDWENSGSASPQRELASVLMDWHVVAGHPDPVGIHETIKGYAEVGGAPSIDGLSSFASYVAALLNHLHTQVTRAIRPTRSEHRDFAHREVEHYLTWFPNRSLLLRVAELTMRAA